MTGTQKEFFTAPFWLLLAMSITVAQSTRIHYIHWNSSNPIFRIDNTDHIIDVNTGNLPWEYDQANIICPVYYGLDSQSGSQMDERYIIYNVSKEEYQTCRITNPRPHVIAMCDKPSQVKYFTITFRSFTPSPGGMEFKPGQDYYFISTSATNDLDRKVGGRCTTHNMKVVFKVAQNGSTSVESPYFPGKPVLNSPRLDGEETGFKGSLTRSGGESSPSSSSFLYPREEVARQQEVHEDNLIYKRLKDTPEEAMVSYSENEVIKQEASRMQRAGDGDGEPGDISQNSSDLRSPLWLSKWSWVWVSLTWAWVLR
ncbi:hypothetical protein TCAL_10289 [Tigriopus californicus]|uniref:Ephrin RBD domain-containing protein n=2 Tax=Tigriopus californicus TaxID=6832 RepID=A0A553NZK4_TIGCA|nr:hypothetical protein TCAL_10289 [Tigriopus californicus]